MFFIGSSKIIRTTIDISYYVKSDFIKIIVIIIVILIELRKFIEI